MYNKLDKRTSSKFEFLLKINGNIICQRYFNVREFNPTTINSVELIDEIDYIKNDLKSYLKMRTLNYLYDQYNQYTNMVNLSEQDLEGSEDEIFEIEIKKDGRNIINTYIPSDCYPTRVRYTVDIRPMIPRILGDLSDILSLKKVTAIKELY